MGFLDGRVVIVTGGGRGIGRSHCLELASHGAQVVVADPGGGVHGEPAGPSGSTTMRATERQRRSGQGRPAWPGNASETAEAVVSEIEAGGGTAMADGTSVTDWDGIAHLVERTVETFGRLDAVVNNAGILRDRMITSLTEDDWDAVIAVHLKGTFAVTKHACDHWRAEAKAGRPVTGRVINTTSGAGLFGSVGQANYGAAKAAIAGLTTVTAMEMDRYGVTANALSPIARTRMTEGILTDTDAGFDRLDPANSSPVVAWLASEGSGWLTGSVLRVDGDTVHRVQPWHVDRTVGYSSAAGGRLDATELQAGLRRAFRVIPGGIASAG